MKNRKKHNKQNKREESKKLKLVITPSVGLIPLPLLPLSALEGRP